MSEKQEMKQDVKRMESIKVYNYGTSKIVLPTRDKDRQIVLAPAVDGEPSFEVLTWSEVDYANSNSPIIKFGLARFDDDIKEDMYISLRNTKWKEMLFDDDIVDIILHPTLETLKKIVAITNNLQICKVKSILTHLKSSGKDVSIKVDDVINRRYREISRGWAKTDIVLTPNDVTKTVASVEDVSAIKAENKAMADELAKMKAMMEQLMANQKQSTNEANNTDSKTTETKEQEIANDNASTPKKPGRPPKTDS